MNEIEQRVARGVAVLDFFYPDWEFRVRPEDLALSSCKRCVLGQLFGGLAAGVERFGHEQLDDGDWLHDAVRFAEDCGFDAYEDPPTELPALTAEWRRVIAQRRAATVPAEQPR